MTISRGLRLAAIAMALTGVIDPSWTVSRKTLPPVELLADSRPGADEVRREITEALRGRLSFDAAEDPVARVLVGEPERVDRAGLGGVPVSGVILARETSPNVRIVGVKGPHRVPLGWTAAVDVHLEGRGMSGQSSTLVIEDRGTAVGRVEHRWTRDQETANLTIGYAPPAEGSAPIALRLTSSRPEADNTDNAVSLVLRSTASKLRVLAYEPRPSWSSAFVRRALEANPAFTVAALTRPSRGVAVTAGSPPERLNASALAPFDVVIVGAPEELQPSDVDALRAFLRLRGGSVVFVPDRRPSGPFLQLLSVKAFDEVLVETALDLTAGGARLKAAELAIPSSRTDELEVLAGVTVRGETRPAVFRTRLGLGRIVFSGALDAWRFRAASGDGFAAFWEARIAEAALAAPRRLELDASPGIAPPGAEVAINVRVRPTEFVESPEGTRIPPVSARLVGAGVDEPIRLWPSAEVGLFTGRVTMPQQGRYGIQVSCGDATVDEDVLSVESAASAAPSAAAERDRLELIARATGGIAASASDRSALLEQLRTLPAGERREGSRPSRSLGFMIAFAALACGEWVLRRRRGLP